MTFTFEDYYYEYLGIDKRELNKGKRVFSTNQRNKPLNGQFVALEGKKIVSTCKISDIDFGGENIAVWTDLNYRNKGFGKQVVTESVKWCINNNVLPIYWVDSENTDSVCLAKSLGFEIRTQEIVVFPNYLYNF